MLKLLFGPVKEPVTHGETINDLAPREWLLIAPICVLCVVLGVYPQFVLRTAQPDIDTVAFIADQARARAGIIPVAASPAEHTTSPQRRQGHP